MNSKIIVIVIVSSCFSLMLHAQNNDELLAKGIKYKTERNLKEGFPIFQKLLKSDSSNALYLINTSYFYTKVGNTLSDEAVRLKYFNTASYLAKKAIVLDTKNAESHYVYAMALGRINEFASSSQQ